MSDTDHLVTDAQGLQGLLLTGRDANTDVTAVELESGDRVPIDRSRLVPREGGGYHYEDVFSTAGMDAADTIEEHRIPLAREQAQVRRETRETGRVRITKEVREHVETFEEPILEETVSVDRVPIDRVVETPPPTRQEGDVLVIPVVEERLVLTKELVLKEEVHVTRKQREQGDTQNVTLRSEEVNIEREEIDGPEGDA